MIPYTCPHCGLYTEVEPQYAGLSGACYGCGKTITVPPIHGAAAYAGVATASRPLGAMPNALAERSKRGLSGAVVVAVSAAALMVMVCLVGLAISYFTPAIGIGRGLVARGQCEENLQRIGQALLMYEMEYGSFPPAFTTDAQGKRMHSWRVLILPYLGHRDLYAQYTFSEPWDGPNNLALVSMMPPVYNCPADSEAVVVGETSYLAVQGAGTMWPGAVARKTAQATDGTSSTILVVESRATTITWTQPDDLDALKIMLDVNSGADAEIGGNHEQGAHVVMVDGSVRFLRTSTPPEAVEALLSPQGGETVAAEYLGN